MLIIFSGLPGTGKTTVARELARVTGGVHLRIDSIEQALREAGIDVEGEGYAVAYSVAQDNLRVGRIVIADCVNPWPLTRDSWRAVAARAGTSALDVEFICSDTAQHRHRIDTRTGGPTWQQVLDRDYRPWDRERLVLDTSRMSLHDAVSAVLAAIEHLKPQAL